MSRQMTCHHCGGLHSGDKCTKASGGEKTRRDRQDDLAIDLEGKLLSAPALDIIEAVLAGAEITDGRWRSLPYGIPPYPRWQEWTVSTEDKPCPTCGGSGEVPAFTLNVSTGEQKMTGTMKCWKCFGTGKKEK